MSVQWGQAASGICGLLDCGEYKKEEEKSLEKEILRFEQVTGRGQEIPDSKCGFYDEVRLHLRINGQKRRRKVNAYQDNSA